MLAPPSGLPLNQRQIEQITSHRCLGGVGSMKNSLWVLDVTFIFSFIALLQALHLKHDRVGSHVFERDLLVPHTLRIYGVGEKTVVSADDVEFKGILWLLNPELKFLFGVVVGKAAGGAGNVERRAHHTVEGPGRHLSDHYGFS